MRAIGGKGIVGLLSVIVLSSGILAGCQSQQAGVGSGTGTNVETGSGGGKRELTVVKDTKQPTDVGVERIHRIEGANIEKWLSDDELRIMTTKMVKAATETEEAKFSYQWSILNLLTGQNQSIVSKPGRENETLKETVSPDGKFSFIQKWTNKYTANNAIKDRATGVSRELKIDNYIEMGDWLDNSSYILAAGSMKDRGDIWQIFVDGTQRKLDLNDSDTEPFLQLSAANGYIYYTDSNNTLKRFTPSNSQPTIIAKDVSDFTISPDSKVVAVSTARNNNNTDTKLVVYDSTGKLQGSLIGKGDLLPYVSWSPDSSKLAFVVYTEEKSGMNGVYIFDSVSGKVSPIGPAYYPLYPLSWNPSGTRLGITIEDKDSTVVTQIIDFK